MKRETLFFIIILCLILLYIFVRYKRISEEGYADAGGMFGKEADAADIIKREAAIISKKFSDSKNIKNGGNPKEGDYNFLINYNIIAQKDGGYLGSNFIDGAFKEDTAVKYATAFGARMIILNINDYDGAPLLVARDNVGRKVSNNVGSVKDALIAIRDAAYSDVVEGRSNEMRVLPMVVYLRFSEKNDKLTSKISQKCAENMANYLSMIKDMVLTTSSESAQYTHRGNQTDLFLTRPELYVGKIIILTNADTSEFDNRNKSSSGGKLDFDYFINGRVWKFNEKIDSYDTRAMYEISYDELNMMNDDGAKDFKMRSRVNYFIAYPQTKMEIKPEDIDKAVSLGVQACAGYLFDDKHREAINKSFKGGGTMLKKPELAYKLPAPIVVDKASKEMDSNGGIVTAPRTI